MNKAVSIIMAALLFASPSMARGGGGGHGGGGHSSGGHSSSHSSAHESFHSNAHDITSRSSSRGGSSYRSYSRPSMPLHIEESHINYHTPPRTVNVYHTYSGGGITSNPWFWMYMMSNHSQRYVQQDGNVNILMMHNEQLECLRDKKPADCKEGTW